MIYYKQHYNQKKCNEQKLIELSELVYSVYNENKQKYIVNLLTIVVHYRPFIYRIVFLSAGRNIICVHMCVCVRVRVRVLLFVYEHI